MNTFTTNEFPQTNGGRRLHRGDSFDPEDFRMTHRLRVASGILRGLGIEPTYEDHAETCINHEANLGRRMMTYRGERAPCDRDCPRGSTVFDYGKFEWPEWATGDIFDLAYKLADAVQTERGQFHQRQISRDRAERERAERATA